jgi:hypothetical protein
MGKVHFSHGAYTEVAAACAHLAMISMSRFKDLERGAMLRSLSLDLLSRYPERYTVRRKRAF